MIVRSPKSLALSFAALLVAAALIVIGALRPVAVQLRTMNKSTDFSGMEIVTGVTETQVAVPEKKMVVYATYSGVTREAGKLTTSDDPNSKTFGGRKACPT